MTATAKDAGLKRPAMTTDFGSNAPMSTTDTVSTTSSPSSTGTRDPTRNVRGLGAKRSHTTSTIVAVAMPPIRFPAARPRWPDSAAEIVIANSGRLPAMASSTIPPIASPIPRRRSSSSVDFESSTPVTHVAPDAATNTRITRNVERDATVKLSPMRSAGRLMRHGSQCWHASVMPSCPQPSLALRCGTATRVKPLKDQNASTW